MNNINPSLWGGDFWRAMHYITISYPDNPRDRDKENMNLFFQSVGRILPCEKCRVHFAQNLLKYPLTDDVLSSRYNLINWLRNIHNEVNKELNKKQWSYQDVIDYYSKDKAGLSCAEILTICLLILIIVIVVVYVKYVRKNA